MNDLEAVYSLRTMEINEWLDLICQMEKKPLSNNLFVTTLKATSFLLFYNLLENIVYVMFENLFDRIKYERLSFDMLHPKIKEQYNRYRCKDNLISDQEMMELSFKKYSDKIRVFSGNLDAREIRKLLEKWGICTDIHVEGEYKLLDIKNHRNTLAHGQRSFKNIGREYCLRQLEEYFEALKEYIRALICVFQRFLRNGTYKVPLIKI